MLEEHPWGVKMINEGRNTYVVCRDRKIAPEKKERYTSFTESHRARLSWIMKERGRLMKVDKMLAISDASKIAHQNWTGRFGGVPAAKVLDFPKFNSLKDIQLQTILKDMLVYIIKNKGSIEYKTSAYTLGIENMAEWRALRDEIMMNSSAVCSYLNVKNKFVLLNNGVTIKYG